MSEKTAGAKSDSTNGKPSPPRLVVLTAGALLLSGVFAVIAPLTLFGGAADKGGWLYNSATKANDKLYGTATSHKTGYLEPSKLIQRIHDTPKQYLIINLVLLVALAVLAASAYRGKYWARWTTLGLWIVATLTGTLAGIGSLTLIAATSIDITFRIPAFLSALMFVVAVVLTNTRPSIEFFKINKPVRATPAGRQATAQRRGMFAPRPATTPPETRASVRLSKDSAQTRAGTDRARAKVRADARAESAAKGAQLARSRAKASKSRRTGV